MSGLCAAGFVEPPRILEKHNWLQMSQAFFCMRKLIVRVVLLFKDLSEAAPQRVSCEFPWVGVESSAYRKKLDSFAFQGF